MLIRRLSEIESIVAGDETILKEVINPSNSSTNINYSLAHATVKPGQQTLPHTLNSSEAYYLLAGMGEVNINGEKQKLNAGELVYIPPKAVQSIKNIGNTDLIFLCICDPAWNKEDENIL